jgi:hypothetical protein
MSNSIEENVDEIFDRLIKNIQTALERDENMEFWTDDDKHALLALITEARLKELEKVDDKADGWELQTEDKLQPYVRQRLAWLRTFKKKQGSL